MSELLQGVFSFEEDKCNEMITVVPLTTKAQREQEYYKNPLICNYCTKSISYKQSVTHSYKKRLKKDTKCFCSKTCVNRFINNKKRIYNENKYNAIPIKCEECFKFLTYDQKRKYSGIRKHKKNRKAFCSKSCASHYNNRNREKKFPNRSKLEILCEEVLCKDFQNISFKFNDIFTIGMELDIFIPELKLAFEFNGPTHYKDIFSNPKKFNRTLQIDKEKKNKCNKLGIDLVVFDVSKKSGDSFNQEILKEVKEIIEEKLEKNQMSGIS